jgi:lipopolysaccharide transport system ATP-binding protein
MTRAAPSAVACPPVAAAVHGGEAVIEVHALGKRYEIYDRPQDRLRQAIVPRVRRAVGLAPRAYFREFWALRGVTFDVARGEAMAIIGRNGAGKSTLLQLIAGTLTPTEGSMRVRGRVAALLELGSGFNPEFTGRENVLLNASLLGLSTAQALERFDDIASFADIGDFIEQPVKMYSSGMLMRLAFAVQTAVTPDVLIVDEALSVGDVFFQAKCMARMRKLLADGVTLLWVSHDPGTVRQLCSRAVLLHHGRQETLGDAAEVTDRYLHLQLEERNAAGRGRTGDAAPETPAGAAAEAPGPASAPDARALPRTVPWHVGAGAFAEKARFNRSGTRIAGLENVQMLKHGKLADVFDFGDEVVLRQAVRFARPLANVNVSYKVRTPQGVDLLYGDTRLAGRLDARYDATLYLIEWTLRLDLMHGNYVLMSALAHPPDVPGEDWVFLDVVPVCYDFRMLPRKEGMIDGFVASMGALQILQEASAPRAADTAAVAGS